MQTRRLLMILLEGVSHFVGVDFSHYHKGQGVGGKNEFAASDCSDSVQYHTGLVYVILFI